MQSTSVRRLLSGFHWPRLCAAALLTALLLAAAGCVTPQVPVDVRSAPESAVLPVDPEIVTGTLENGLTYYVRRNLKPENRAELRLVVNAGSLQEDDDQRGLAHFVEHMAFNGTESFEKQKIVEYLESIGMSFGPEVNAYTTFDETVYKLQIPTDDPKIEETAVQILEEWAHRITFDAVETVKERPIIVEEWRLRRGADARMRDIQYPVLFKDSRYAVREPIGKMEIVQKAEAADLKRFYRDWYRPDLMAVVAAGDFDTARMVDLIRSHFGRIPAAVKPRPRLLSPVPDTPGTLYAPATDPEATTTRVALYVKHPVKVVRTFADYRRRILENLYDGMLNKRIDEIARRPGSSLASGGAGSARLVRSKDAYVLSARVREDRIGDALETLLTEAERVRRHGFTASELEREKRDLLSSIAQYYADRQNIPSDNVAGFLVDNFLEQEPLTSVETDYAVYNRFVSEIGLDEVNRLAGELVTADNRVVLVNAPAKQAPAVPGAAQVGQVFDRVARADIAPYEDRVAGRLLFTGPLRDAAVVSRTEVPGMGITEWKLDNGVAVTLKPTDFKTDEVLFGATSPGGTSLVSDADYTAAVAAPRIVADSGVDGLDSTTLRKLLAGKTVDVAPWISDLQEGLGGSARPEDLETLFQLIVLYMTEPRKDSEAYQVYLQRLKTSLENRASSPRSVFFDTIADLLSQQHPRGRAWGPERLKEMDLDASLRVYRDRFKDAGDFHFFFVGSFSLAGIEPLVRRYLGSLPSQGRVESWRDVGIRPPKGIVRKEVRKGLEPQSRVELLYSGSTPWSLANSLQVAALGRVMDIRIREVVREEAGGSYDAGVSAQLNRFPTEEYTVSIGFGCAPQNVEAMTGLALREVSRMREQGPNQVDVANVKEMLSREHEQNLRENGYWLGTLQMLSLNGLDPRAMLDFDKRLAAVTAQSLRAKAGELLRPDAYLQVVLYPEGR